MLGFSWLNYNAEPDVESRSSCRWLKNTTPRVLQKVTAAGPKESIYLCHILRAPIAYRLIKEWDLALDNLEVP